MDKRQKQFHPICALTAAKNGEESLWGRGYGKSALSSALETAFFTLRAKKVVAKTYPENTRSVRSALSCGFVCTRNDSRLHTYSILANDFFDRRKNKLAPGT